MRTWSFNYSVSQYAFEMFEKKINRIKFILYLKIYYYIIKNILEFNIYLERDVGFTDSGRKA